MTDSYDVIVIGGGPGGYVAAIRCAQLGLSTACVDQRADDDGRASFGGACLNVGCIPSKALLDSSEAYARLQHEFPAHGIAVEGASVDIGAMMARKDGIVGKLTGGVAMLLKANKVDAIHARAKLLKGRAVELSAPGADARTIAARHIILAPGSTPIELSDIPFDHDAVIDSTGALALDAAPGKLGVIGAGVIGLELGSVWRRLGSEVVILEALDEFLGAADHQIAREAARQFKRQGLDIRLGASVKKAVVRRATKTHAGAVQVEYERQGATEQIEVNRLIVAVGRRPATDDLLADDSGVGVDARGFIEVNQHCRTAAENVWAVGDAVRGPMLAHKSSEEGVAVAERIKAGNDRVGQVDFNTVPWVIYTDPEIAWVGQTERQLKAQDIPIRIGAFPFAATGRALAMESPHGMVKLIAHADTDRLLGAHLIGPHASELVAECVLAMEYHASSEDLARTIHAHPTLSEAVHEAALAVDKRAIHKAR
ncbi:MAG: dihydrolipoyl dehydrogenase [bacterium]